MTDEEGAPARHVPAPGEPGPGPEPEPMSGQPPTTGPNGRPPHVEGAPKRPLLERIGMAGIALVLAATFGAVAAAAFSGGEPFLGLMGAIGCLMTLWVGALTLFRG